MGSSASITTSALISKGINSFSSGYIESSAYEAEASFKQTMANINADIAEMQAEDALRRGKLDVQRHRKNVKQFVGSQRAALAAQGIEVNDNTALELQTESEIYGEIDALTIKNNAYREAWGYKVQALDYTNQGALAKIQGSFGSTSSILSGGIGAISNFAQAGYTYFSNRNKDK